MFPYLSKHIVLLAVPCKTQFSCNKFHVELNARGEKIKNIHLGASLCFLSSLPSFLTNIEKIRKSNNYSFALVSGTLWTKRQVHFLSVIWILKHLFGFFSFFLLFFVLFLQYFPFLSLIIHLGYSFITIDHLKSAFLCLTNVYSLPHLHTAQKRWVTGYKFLTEPWLVSHEHYLLLKGAHKSLPNNLFQNWGDDEQ